MENKRIDLEYPLSAKSRNIVWGLIGNPPAKTAFGADDLPYDVGGGGAKGVLDLNLLFFHVF